MENYTYGHQPCDIDFNHLQLNWFQGIRNLASTQAKDSEWHSHSEMQLMYCFKGEFTYEFEGRESCTLTAGKFLIIPAKVRHRHARAVDPRGHRCEMLFEPGMSSCDFSLIPRSCGKRIFADLLDSACIVFNCTPTLDRIFTELDEMAVKGGKKLDDFEIATARTLATMVLLRCHEICVNATNSSEDDERAKEIEPVLEWLRNNFTNDIDVSHLHLRLGCSASHLYSVFKRKTGLSLREWVILERMRLARQILEDTDLPISEIAKKCGFKTQQYFATTFRLNNGVSPATWRRVQRASQVNK